MSAPQPGYKRCPDCAEDVREEARRCRFCGYSFEPRSARPWLGYLRRPADGTSVGELLASWGADLGPGEAPERIAYCRLGDAAGYLVVTSRRVLFFSVRRPRALLELDRDGLAGRVRAARFGRGALELDAPQGTVLLRGFAGRGDLDELGALLRLAP